MLRLGLVLPVLCALACGELHRRNPLPEDRDAPIGMLDGRPVHVSIAGTSIARIDATASESRGYLWPPIIDSHVHVTFWPVADKLALTGIATVVDLAAPERSIKDSKDSSPIHVIAAGPMLTRPAGYPLESWGSDGYGIGCADEACVRTTIERLASEGVGLIKLALGDNGLDPALVPIAVTAAHAKKLKVAAHALDDAAALLAAKSGVDILAHTPTEALADATISAWRGRAVISTLAAFGAPAAIDNLRKLRAAGCIILYGTDLGNLRDAGPSAAEIHLLDEAGLDNAAITAAMTTVPAKFWGLPTEIAATNEASFLLLDRDPRLDAHTLLTPRGVWLRGRRVRRVQ